MTLHYHMPHNIHFPEDFFCDKFWKRERMELYEMKSYEFSMFLTEKFLNIGLFYFSFWKKINEKNPK